MYLVVNVSAQFTTKDLNPPLYNGQGQPSNTNFTPVITTPDSVVFTQQTDGLNFVTKGSWATPVAWYASSNNGFTPSSNGYTVEAKVAVNKSLGNGFDIEAQSAVGNRVQIAIDTTAIYDLTNYPASPKVQLYSNLDNRGMHTYRVAVDNTNTAYIYRDGTALAYTNANGGVSSSGVYTALDSVLTDQFFEDYISNYSPPFAGYTNEAAFKADLSGNWDISYANWAHMGIDTVSANVKVGKTSMWFQNGTTGNLTIKRAVTAGKWMFSFWSKVQATYMAYKGSIAMDGTGGAVLVPSTIMVNGNTNYNYKSYVFDVPVDGTLNITFFNGWGSPTPGWASIWFDDMRITKVNALPYVRFGKDTDRGVTDVTVGSFTYDATGPYSPATSAVKQLDANPNVRILSQSNGKMQISYQAANNGTLKWDVLSLAGEVISRQSTMVQNGNNTLEINIPQLQGVYILRLIDNSTTGSCKFFVR